MNLSSCLRLHFLVGLCLWAAAGAVSAQGLGLATTVTPSPIVVNNSLTYSIRLTNTSGLLLTDVIVANTLPASATFLSATNNFGTISTNAGVVVFRVDVLTINQAVTLAVAARPTASGAITNVVIASDPVVGSVTNTLVTTVHSAVTDLAVGLSGLASGVLSNDVIAYTLSATNLGPAAAPNVVLSNSLPAGIQFLSIAPTNAAISVGSNHLVVNLGTLASGSATNFSVTIQPTNAGTFMIPAHIGAVDLLDSNLANNSATNTLTVGAFLTGQLLATVISTQTYNPQTGLMEQTIRLENIGSNTVAAARVIVSGLTNQLFNAVGTNSGSPYVVHASELAPNASVDLLLEYFVPARVPVPDPTLLAVEVPAIDVSVPGGPPPNISRLVQLAPGRILIEFDSIAGRSYTVLYSDNATFTNYFVAHPAITAPANRTQWIDNGPPKTLSPPGAARFYRVLTNP